MEKLLPIVPGCKALMLPTEFQYTEEAVTIFDLPAHEVKVIGRCAYLNHSAECPKCAASNFWFIESPMLTHDTVANCACQLMRIDGGNFSAEEDSGLWGLSTQQIRTQLRRTQ